MATTKTIKSAGGDYANLAAAITGEAATTGDLIFDCFAVNLGSATIQGRAFTTLFIQANASARHAGLALADPSAVARLSGSGSIAVRQSGVTIDGLLIDDTCGVVYAVDGTWSNIVVQGATDSTGAGLSVQGSVIFNANPVVTADCIAVYGARFIGARGVPGDNTPTSGTLNIRNSSGYSTSGQGVIRAQASATAGRTGTATVNATNCAVFGSTDGFYELLSGSGGTETAIINLSYCTKAVGDAVSGTVSHGQTSTAVNEFTNTAADLRLKAGALSINAGTAVGLATDIAGVTRDATPDIGAFDSNTAPTPPPSGGGIIVGNSVGIGIGTLIG